MDTAVLFTIISRFTLLFVIKLQITFRWSFVLVYYSAWLRCDYLLISEALCRVKKMIRKLSYVELCLDRASKQIGGYLPWGDIESLE